MRALGFEASVCFASHSSTFSGQALQDHEEPPTTQEDCFVIVRNSMECGEVSKRLLHRAMTPASSQVPCTSLAIRHVYHRL